MYSKSLNSCQQSSRTNAQLYNSGIFTGALVFLISGIVVSVGFIPSNANVVIAQIGSMATLQNIDATYAVSIIPGAAQRESAYHYYHLQLLFLQIPQWHGLTTILANPILLQVDHLMLLISELYLTQV